MDSSLIVVLGDIHHQFGLAIEGLDRIEQAYGRGISQVFTVGDLGLFLQEEDWKFLTGPKKYREPEISPELRKAWAAWRWPTATIAGNHEPFHLLRGREIVDVEGMPNYTDAGWLPHSVNGLRVAGLSGIFHHEHLEFMSTEQWERNPPQNWLELVNLVHKGAASPRRLSYYKEYEVSLMKSLKPQPHLLLLHDWPVAPEGINTAHPRRPEMEIVETLCPSFVCCGHHHRHADMIVGKSRVIALNLIHHKQDYANRISSDWAAIFTWDGLSLELHQTWPSK